MVEDNKDKDKTGEFVKRSPEVKQDFFSRCDLCLGWYPLEPEDKKDGSRGYALRLDPLAIVNERKMVYVCFRCWQQRGYDRETKRKIVDDRIIEYYPEDEPANKELGGKISTSQPQDNNEPEYKKTGIEQTSHFRMYC